MNRVATLLRELANAIDDEGIKIIDATGGIGNRKYPLAEVGERVMAEWSLQGKNSLYLTLTYRPGSELTNPQRGTVPEYVDPKVLARFMYEKLVQLQFVDSSWGKATPEERAGFLELADDVLRRLQLEAKQQGNLDSEGPETEEPGDPGWSAPTAGDGTAGPPPAGPELRSGGEAPHGGPEYRHGPRDFGSRNPWG